MITIQQLNFSFNQTPPNVHYEKLISIQPTKYVSLLMDRNIYKNLTWVEYGNERNIYNGHTKSLNRIFLFLNYITNYYNNKKKNNDEFVYNFNISTKTLQHYFNNKYPIYLEILKSIGLFERCENSTYQPECYSFTYKIAKDYINCLDYSLVFFNKNYNIDENKYIENAHRLNVDIKKAKVDARMLNTLNVLKLNKMNALTAEINNHIENNTEITNLIYRINNVISFGYNKSLTIGKKVNRLFHHISNISSIARKHLNIKFKFVDITNCQPLLLAYTMKSNNYNVDDNYITDVENGSFYEQLMFLHSNRNETKVSIYKNLFFGFNVGDDTNKLFKKLYPNVWEYLNQVNSNKDNSGQTLASILQNIETEIFADVPSVCENSGYLFTLHDSIYFDNDNDEQPVKKHLTKKFAEYGLQVNFNNN